MVRCSLQAPVRLALPRITCLAVVTSVAALCYRRRRIAVTVFVRLFQNAQSTVSVTYLGEHPRTIFSNITLSSLLTDLVSKLGCKRRFHKRAIFCKLFGYTLGSLG